MRLSIVSSPHYTDGETDDQDYRVKKWQDRDLSPGSLLPWGAFWMTLWLPSKYTQAIKPLVDTTLESPWSPALWSYACSMDLPLPPHPPVQSDTAWRKEGRRMEDLATELRSQKTMGERRDSDNTSVYVLFLSCRELSSWSWWFSLAASFCLHSSCLQRSLLGKGSISTLFNSSLATPTKSQ